MDISYYKKFEPIQGKWYLTKEIGRGAYGVVFEAERRDLIKATCAIKVVSIPSSQYEIEAYRQENHSLDDKSVTSYFYGLVEEFLKEIKMMSLFQGALNIVNIEDYEVKQRQNEIGWDIFISMELLTPINKYFSMNEITEKDVLKLGLDICASLEECKKQNVIHRDIKPGNIFISPNGDFKLGDFGVARTLEKTSSGLSKKGTYTYMAPEVYKGEAYNAGVDIYSLGIVMYKLLNNNFEPFKTGSTFADEENALIRRMKGEKIVSGPANASRKLADVILKACSYDPEERFKSPTEMRRALERCLKEVNDTVINSRNDVRYDDEESVGIFNSGSASGNNSSESNNNDAGSTASNMDAIIISRTINFVLNKFYVEHGIDISNDKIVVSRLETCIKEKVGRLSVGIPIIIDLPYFSATAEGPIHLKMEISPDDVSVDGNFFGNIGNVHTNNQYSNNGAGNNFNENSPKQGFSPEQDDDGTVGIFSSRNSKQKATSMDSDDSSSYETTKRQNIHNNSSDDAKTNNIDDIIVEKVFNFARNKFERENGIHIDDNDIFTLAYKAIIKENIKKLKSGEPTLLDFGYSGAAKVSLKVTVALVNGVVIEHGSSESAKGEIKDEKKCDAESKKKRRVKVDAALVCAYILLFICIDIIPIIPFFGIPFTIGMLVVIVKMTQKRKKK